jgi:chromate transporter
MVELILIFFYIGLLTIGGGIVAIPIIQQEVVSRGLISLSDFILMIGIAESTPGPIGINVATFVGYDQFGIIGAAMTTVSFILPSFFILLFSINTIKKYRQTLYVNQWFKYLKAVVAGLIMYATLTLVEIGFFVEQNGIQPKSLIVLGILILVSIKLYKKPWAIVLIGGILGILIY